MNNLFLILIATSILNTIPTFASEQGDLSAQTAKPRAIFGEKRIHDEKAQEIRNKMAQELRSEFFAITGREAPLTTHGPITVDDIQKLYSQLAQARRDKFLFKKPKPKRPTFVPLWMAREKECGRSKKCTKHAK